MQHPFTALQPEYESLLAHMVVTRPDAVDVEARRLLGFLPHYADVQRRTGVPAIWLATVFEREASSDFRLYFGNGDPLDRPTRDVPRGRGPFTGSNAWEDGAIDALHFDHIDQVPMWSWAMLCYEGELWNGFGPRAHGIHTGYLWAGASAYSEGKYVEDGVWSATTVDHQLGIVPVARRMVELQPSLDIGAWPMIAAVTSPPAAPAAAPVGHQDAQTLQEDLNTLGADPPLLVDGSYGRQTRRVVEVFQAQAGLEVDGIAGPATWAAINQALASKT